MSIMGGAIQAGLGGGGGERRGRRGWIMTLFKAVAMASFGTVLVLMQFHNLPEVLEGAYHGPSIGVKHQEGRRSMLESEQVDDLERKDSLLLGGSFSFSMIHRDHVDSPLRSPGDSAAQNNRTFAERLKDAIRRSRQHTQSIRHKIQMLTCESDSSDGDHDRESSNNHDHDHRRETQLMGVKSPSFAQDGEYIIYINLGNPAKQFVAILDSGSDLVWVQCKPCTTCLQEPDPLFDPSKSSSYTKLPCASVSCKALPPSPTLPSCNRANTCVYQYQYGDGTTTQGILSTETLTLPSTVSGENNKSIPSFAFGCGQVNSGDLAGSDGIVGIGKGLLSLPSQLGSIVGKKFSFCLVNMFEVTTKTSPLIVGNDSILSAMNATWTPIIPNPKSPTFYYVQMLGMKLGGIPIAGIPASAFAIQQNGAGGTIIDTGTTITELVPEAYDALVLIVQTTVNYPLTDGSLYGFDVCWDTSSATVSSAPVFPAITFQFKGLSSNSSSSSDFTLPMESAFLAVDYNVVCLGFSTGYDMNIIGNVQLQNFQIFVNNDDHILGWKSTQCDLVQ